MADHFFMGFAAHAHTMNELETDQQRELELRRRNSPGEAQKLVGKILDKLEGPLLASQVRNLCSVLSKHALTHLDN